ncbi:MAG: hypothetical protein AAB381_00680 [Patescibacteria group bacterium]
MNPQQSPATETSKTKPMMMLLTGILVLIIVVLYIFASRTPSSSLPNENLTTETTEVQPVTNSSDDVSSIEADLNTSITGLDEQNF